MRIAMIGTGYVGLVSGACFADFGHQVTCVDKDGETRSLAQQSKSNLGGDVHPIEAPGKRNSPSASAVQNNNHCLQQDVNVEPDGPVSNIEEILRLLSLQIAVAPR